MEHKTANKRAHPAESQTEKGGGGLKRTMGSEAGTIHHEVRVKHLKEDNDCGDLTSRRCRRGIFKDTVQDTSTPAKPVWGKTGKKVIPAKKGEKLIASCRGKRGTEGTGNMSLDRKYLRGGTRVPKQRGASGGGKGKNSQVVGPAR